MNNRFYLIQRCTATCKDASVYRKGVDTLLTFDYMGSAEFEFGTIPHSFRLLRDLATQGKLRLEKTVDVKTYQNKPFWTITPADWDMKELEGKLTQLGKVQVRTKESSYFEYWVKGDRLLNPEFKERSIIYRKRVSVWMACVERHEYEKLPAVWSANEGLMRKLFAELSRVEPVVGADDAGLRN